jgi:hypothetical protein
MTLNITTSSIKALFVTLSINDTQHKGLNCDTQHNNTDNMLSVVMLGVVGAIGRTKFLFEK